jgi:hypothetical protein
MIMEKETCQEIVILSYMQSVIRPNMHTNMAEVFFFLHRKVQCAIKVITTH